MSNVRKEDCGEHFSRAMTASNLGRGDLEQGTIKLAEQSLFNIYSSDAAEK